MSDEDDSSKTEEPSSKKLSEAAARGDMPRSMELQHIVMIGGATIAVSALAGTICKSVYDMLIVFVQQPHRIAIDKGGFIDMMRDLVINLALTVAPLFAVMAILSIASSVIQNPPTIASNKFEDMLSHLSPIAGLKKILSKQNLVELGKNIFKFVLVGGAAISALAVDFKKIELLAQLEPMLQLKETERLVMAMLKSVVGALIVLGLADYVYQRYQHRQKLMMTKQEVKEEHKQQEGDPQIKGRLRSLRMQRARQRMMAAVPTADVVVTNPTHYAVALKYIGVDLSAPKVVAKGLDHIALRIREMATEAEVPIVENPPLARALYTVDLDQEIPEKYYRAVAEVISYVMRLKRKLPGAQYRPTQPVEDPAAQ